MGETDANCKSEHRATLRAIVTRKGKNNRIPELLEKELDELEAYCAQREREARQSLIKELKKHAPKDFKGARQAFKAGKIDWPTLRYCESYNQANAEWRKIIAALTDQEPSK